MSNSDSASLAAMPDGIWSRIRTQLNAVGEHKTLLIVLILADLMLCILHVLNRVLSTDALSSFSLSAEFAIPESFQYAKWLTIALVFALVWRIRRVGLYLFWAGAFVFIAIDDAFALHEALGGWFDKVLNLHTQTDSLRGEDLGELMSAALFGSVLLIGAVLVHKKADPLARARAWTLYLLMFGLGLFGIVIDVVHSYAWMRWHIPGGVAIEEGGEMAIASVKVVLLVGLYMRDRREIAALPTAPERSVAIDKLGVKA